MPIRIHFEDYDKCIVGLDVDEDYLLVEDPENLYLFPGDEGFRGFYFFEHIVLEIHGNDGLWWYVDCFSRWLWKKYQQFIADIQRP